MSWDVSVFGAKESPPPVAEMSNNWRREVLGTGDEVRAKISACFPGVDWTNPTWGSYMGSGSTHEFGIGRDEPNDGSMVHFRRGGEAVTHLMKMAQQCGWYLLDCSQGEWLHHCAETKAGWQGFQAYRDRVIRQNRQ